MDERVEAIEDAFVRHWSIFGRWKHGSLREEDGVSWFETSIPHLPYNVVMRTRIPDDADAPAIVERVASTFRERSVPYLWVVPPSARPTDLPKLLAQQGLDLVENATGMDLDLDGWKPQGSEIHTPDGAEVRIVSADDDPGLLADYVELIRSYWSVPEADRELLMEFNNEWAGNRTPGMRLVAYLNGKPIGKLFLNTTEIPDRIAVYGVAVTPEARGLGIATKLMNEALERGGELGAKRCVLHSSEMAASLYRRMGFVERCTIAAYATAPLFGTHHH